MRNNFKPNQIIWKNMESDSIKRQLSFNEPIINNHIILRRSLLLFLKKRIDFGAVDVWSRFKSSSIKKK